MNPKIALGSCFDLGVLAAEVYDRRYLQTVGLYWLGACGFNSICSIGADQRPNCNCPNGYSMVHPNDGMSACKKNFIRQSCDTVSKEVGLFGFTKVLNTNWPNSDYEFFGPISEDWCRQNYLDDCLCDVIIYSIVSGCWKKRSPLSSGVIDSSIGGKALIKIRRDNATVNADQNKLVCSS